MAYKAYSRLLLCSDASSMSEMVWELRSRASLTSCNQFCTLALSYVGLGLSEADEIVPRYVALRHTLSVAVAEC
jgi:hypothetical protein